MNNDIYLKNSLFINSNIKLQFGNNIITGKDLKEKLNIQINKTLLNSQLLNIWIDTNFSCTIKSLKNSLSFIATKVLNGNAVTEEVISSRGICKCDYMFDKFCFNFNVLDEYVLYFETTNSTTSINEYNKYITIISTFII